jgi:O-antigen ligase
VKGTASALARRLPDPRAHLFAYRGLILFTILLYLRPNDLLPIGTFPIVKILTVVTLVAFFAERVGQGGPVSVMPRPFKYLLTMAALSIVSIPFGLDPVASLESFTDLFLKILLIFLLMINVVTSFRRLRLMMEVCVLSAAAVALLTLADFFQGKNLVAGYRAAGVVGGILSNPNDLALAMNMLLPFAVVLVLGRRNPFSKLLYGGCATLLAFTSVVTYSRAGFLTIVIAGGFFLFSLGRRYPAAWVVGVLGVVALLATSPGRIFTMFAGSGENASAAESAMSRWELITRSIEVAGGNPIRWLFGVGMNNFHIVSIKELVNHNGYLQVFNEIGLPALCFYVLFLLSAFRITGLILKRYRKARGYRQVWLMAVGIQTSLIAYGVGSFFASVAFLWYVYYSAAFAVCLQQLLARVELPERKGVSPRVWYLRRVQH